jgi:hypothetical protein
MARTRQLVFSAAACCLFLSAAGIAQQHDASQHKIFTPDMVTWAPAPPGLPPGAQVAVLEGDPSKPGAFTMRAKFPGGFKIQPHWHPVDEHVTVIQGTFHMGLGEKFDTAAGKAMSAGSFAHMKQGVRHFAWTTEDTVIQLHGMGPWGINYVNPKDDPRKQPGTEE